MSQAISYPRLLSVVEFSNAESQVLRSIHTSRSRRIRYGNCLACGHQARRPPANATRKRTAQIVGKQHVGMVNPLCRLYTDTASCAF